MLITRICIGLLASTLAVSAQASIIDLSMTGSGGLGQTTWSPGVSSSTSWHNLGGLSQYNPVTIANGDTVNVTLNLDSVAYAFNPFGLSSGYVPTERFGLIFEGLVSGTVTTAGMFVLYLNQQVVAQSQVSGDIGYGVVVDGAPFNNGGYSFDEVVSSFTVSGLDQPASLQLASLNYYASQPTQLTGIPPILIDRGIIKPSFPIPEPSTLPMVMTGGILFAFGKLLNSRSKKIRAD